MNILILLVLLGALAALGLYEVELPSEEGLSKRVDTDNDGLPDSFEIKIGTDPKNADTDNDGIDDWFEAKAPLKYFGGDPRHYPSPRRTDIYLVVHWMEAGEDAHVIPMEAKEELMRVFARGPIFNLDGSTGIRLHIDDGTPGYSLGDGGPIPHEDPITEEPDILTTYGIFNGWDHLYRRWYESSPKAGLYHYVIIAHELEDNAFLASHYPGDSFVIAGARIATVDEWVTVFVLGVARNIGIPVDEFAALNFDDPGFWSAAEENGVGISFQSQEIEE